MRTKLLSMIALGLCLSSGAVSRGDEPVYFECPNLKLLVEAELSDVYHIQILDPTPEEMRHLKRVSRPTYSHIGQITSLVGLEYAINLEFLDPWGARHISDLSPLAGLTKLKTLYLPKVNTKDFSVLAGLVNLEFLVLSATEITDLNVLAGMVNLQHLDLTFGQVTDLGPLAGLTKLTFLDLSHGKVRDLAPLTGLTNLVDLRVGGNPLGGAAFSIHLPRISRNNPNLETLAYEIDWRPSAVHASGGTYPDGVRITWDPLSAPGQDDWYYLVWRAPHPWGDLGPVSEWQETTGFYDPTAQTEIFYSYHIQASLHNRWLSNPSQSVQGWIAGWGSLTIICPPGGTMVSRGHTLDCASSQRTMFPYPAGTEVPIRVIPHNSYRRDPQFAGWVGTAVDAGRVADPGDDTTTVIVDGHYTLSAIFTVPYRVTSSAGGSVIKPGEGDFVYQIDTLVPIEVRPDPGYIFSHWTGTVPVDSAWNHPEDFANLLAQLSLFDSPAYTGHVGLAGVPQEDHWNRTPLSLRAVFAPVDSPYALSVSTTDGGGVSAPGERLFSYDQSTLVPINASAEEGYLFAGWAGTAVTAGKVADPDAADTTVMVDGVYTLRARFEPDDRRMYTLAVSSTDGGRVAHPGEGSFPYADWTEAYLLAVPDPGHQFVGWTGSVGGHTLIPGDLLLTLLRVPMLVNEDELLPAALLSPGIVLVFDWFYPLVDSVSLRAHFTPEGYGLTLSSTLGGAIASPDTEVTTYDAKTVVSIVAAPEPGYIFSEWTGTAVDAGKVASPYAYSTQVMVDGVYTLEANFIADDRKD